jgi:hypothetical protein
VNDFKLLRSTLDRIVIVRPDASPTEPQGICLDKGYDYPEARWRVRADAAYPLARRGEEAARPASRLSRPPLGRRARAPGGITDREEVRDRSFGLS